MRIITKFTIFLIKTPITQDRIIHLRSGSQHFFSYVQIELCSTFPAGVIPLVVKPGEKVCEIIKIIYLRLSINCNESAFARLNII